ncbi:MAG: DUF1344 domain-containing protein [Alphaproteobacteria bacterium]|nr:DUF1344 domain-containing protein [Alphaproteobacteria bacterium]
MNARKRAAGALLLATAVGAAAAANALPAQYVEGGVSAIDYDTRTLTVGAGTFKVRTPGELKEVNPGDKVDIAYVTEAGQRIAIAVALR